MQLRSIIAAIVFFWAAQSALAADEAQVKRGRILFLQCRACHDTQPGPAAVPKVGPSLNGLFGRVAGSQTSYTTYSPAIKASEITWSPETLDKWLERPASLVPGTTMAFAGIASEVDRAAVIAFLEVETAEAEPAGNQ